MKRFNKVVIIGVGLIGGSVGLALKRKKLAKQVTGISRRKKTINTALARGAIDVGCFDLSPVKEADLVVLATPVNTIIQIGTQIKCLLKSSALVTDAGSTKKSVVKKLETVLPNFVGAHPLAGSEKLGVANAAADLFCNSVCILTPTKKTSKTALARIRKFWHSLGARIACLSPAQHDRLISHVSHLPHAIAFALIQSVPNASLHLASGGLKDTTRIASSSGTIWKDILLDNADNVLAALEIFSDHLSKIKTAISRKDAKSLERIIKQANLKRQKLEL